MNTTGAAWLYAWNVGGFQRGSYVDETRQFCLHNLREKKKNNKINKEFSSQRKETVILLSTNMAAMTTAESSGFQVFDMI